MTTPSRLPPPESGVDADLDYRHQQFVCGAIGRPDDAVLDRLRSVAPAPLRPVTRSERAQLWASRAPERYDRQAPDGWFWNPLAEGRRPSSWREAAERRMSAGLTAHDGCATLHTDALGVAELYTRELGDAIYFSSRIHPLTQLAPGPLHQDRVAWACALVNGSPIGSATPFQEIRRMEAAAAWTATPEGLSPMTFLPGWMARSDVAPCPRPEDVVERLADQVPVSRRRRPVSVTLSGGLDSRLLAIVATSRSRRPVRARTTDTDAPTDRDLVLSRPVAEALGMEQTVVVPGPVAWADDASDVRRRLQHQVREHTWLMPLARSLRASNEIVLDGLAGDILLRGLGRSSHVLNASDQRMAVWDMIVRSKLDNAALLGPGVAAEIASVAREAFDQATVRMSGHQATPQMAALLARTTRAVAASPLLVFGPEVDVRLPFLHPDVLETGMSIPLERRLSRAYYGEVLRAADPVVASLPSTNDPMPKPVVRRVRRQLHPEALRPQRQLLRDDPAARALLGQVVLDALDDDDAFARVARLPGALGVLQWAAMMADWRQVYRDQLAD